MRTDTRTINILIADLREIAGRAPDPGPPIAIVDILHDILHDVALDLDAVNARISELHPIDEPAPDARPIARAPSVSAQLAANRLRLSDIHMTLSSRLESLGARVTDLEASTASPALSELKRETVRLSIRVTTIESSLSTRLADTDTRLTEEINQLQLMLGRRIDTLGEDLKRMDGLAASQ
ncbi:hypothetical protein ES703_58507 [subsurface metagenome]